MQYFFDSKLNLVLVCINLKIAYSRIWVPIGKWLIAACYYPVTCQICKIGAALENTGALLLSG